MTSRKDQSWQKYSGVDLTSVSGQTWFLVRVQNNTEKKTADLFVQRKISFFFPAVYDVKRRKSGRAYKVLRALWPQYILGRLDPDQTSLIKNFSFILDVIPIPNESEVLPQLQEINDLIAAGDYSASKLDKLHLGERMKVALGPLEGLEGIITSVKSENRIVLHIDMLGEAASVEIDRDMLEKTEKSPPSESEDNSLELSATIEAMNSELVKYLARHPQAMYEISPRKFEELIAELLRDMGYDVWLTPPAKDGGRDVLAVFPLPGGDILTIVECKRYSPKHRIGPDIIHRLLWIADRQDKASRAMLATTSRFTAGALAIEEEYHWRLNLHDFDAVHEWLNSYGSWQPNAKGGLWLPTTPVILETGEHSSTTHKSDNRTKGFKGPR